MKRLVDFGKDKNFVHVDRHSAATPLLKSMMIDDLPKTADEAMLEARKAAWPQWINSDPLFLACSSEDDGKSYLFFTSERIANKTILVFIWDFNLMPCLRTLSYVQEWHKRYFTAGLIVVGVYSPFFHFMANEKVIEDAVKHFDITFPVVKDFDFEIWRAFENRYWPRLVLMDANGQTHFDVVGEGAYQDLERTLQSLLRSRAPGLPSPPIIKPLREIDVPGYEIPLTSDDVYFGTRFDVPYGNFKGLSEDDRPPIVHPFPETLPETLSPNFVYFTGDWRLYEEGMHNMSLKGACGIQLMFSGTDVFLFASTISKDKGEIPNLVKVQILINDKYVDEDHLGDDAFINEYRRSVVNIKEPRIYHLISKMQHKTFKLRLQVEEAIAEYVMVYGLYFEHRPFKETF